MAASAPRLRWPHAASMSGCWRLSRPSAKPARASRSGRTAAGFLIGWGAWRGPSAIRRAPRPHSHSRRPLRPDARQHRPRPHRRRPLRRPLLRRRAPAAPPAAARRRLAPGQHRNFHRLSRRGLRFPGRKCRGQCRGRPADRGPRADRRGWRPLAHPRPALRRHPRLFRPQRLARNRPSGRGEGRRRGRCQPLARAESPSGALCLRSCGAAQRGRRHHRARGLAGLGNAGRSARYDVRLRWLGRCAEANSQMPSTNG